jgi:hypothetical protein
MTSPKGAIAMQLSPKTQSFLRGARKGARTARLVVLSMFLPTKILTEMAERDQSAR